MHHLKITIILTLVAVAYTKGNNDETKNDNFYFNVVVAFSRIDSNNIRVIICLGVLIRSNWVFLTLECNGMLEGKYGEIGVQTAEEFIKGQDSKLSIAEPIKIKKILSQKYSILRLNRDIEITSSLKLGNLIKYAPRPNNATLVGWDEMRPTTWEVATIINPIVTVKLESKNHYKNFPPGSLLTIGDKIIALSKMDNPNKNLIFWKILEDEEFEIETLLQLKDNLKKDNSRKRKKGLPSNKKKFFKLSK